MTILGIRFGCDTTGCANVHVIAAYDVGYAREIAADRYGWSTTPDGRDHCGPCTLRSEEPG